MKKLAKRITGKEWGNDRPYDSVHLFLGLSRVRGYRPTFRKLQNYWERQGHRWMHSGHQLRR